MEHILNRLKGVTERGTCLRLKVGALIYSKEGEFLSEGWNTSVQGTPTCEESGECLLNEEGRCYRTIHAEVNAILKVDRVKLRDAVMYVSHEPCENCSKVIDQVGIKKVYYMHPYSNALIKNLPTFFEKELLGESL